MQSVDTATGELTTEAVPEADLTGFVRRTDLPTAQQAGPVKLGSGYGLALTAGGELRLAPAGADALAAMSDGWAPVTPALLPLAVKLALASAWASAGWTDADRASARATLGAAEGEAVLAALEALETRVETLELKYGAEVTEHPFTADLAGLQNLTVTGIWDADAARIAF